jgi:hypothetical protein
MIIALLRNAAAQELRAYTAVHDYHDLHTHVRSAAAAAAAGGGGLLLQKLFKYITNNQY